MRVLLTGADGFAGGWLARRLLSDGHDVIGTLRPGGRPSLVLRPSEAARIAWRELELSSGASVNAVAQDRWDVVFHLAAVSSGNDARNDPGRAWETNAAGTARLAEALGDRHSDHGEDPLLLLVSTGEVYGLGSGTARRETDVPRPCSSYAGSKLGGEIAVLEASYRTGLRVIVARAFPHTGPHQDDRFVLPALANRLVTARRLGARVIKTGNIEVVRDFLDVRDAVSAYLALAQRGTPGETYNVASGVAHSIGDILKQLQKLLGWEVTPEPDARLYRRSDILHLVGDPAKLHRATGWQPVIPLDQTLRDLVDAQTS